MKNMQRRFLKNLVVFTILFLAPYLSTSAQITSYRLKTADSLFQARRYMQSFQHYQAMLQHNEYTPSMLLKMAFIQEGLGNIGQAMYYLNLYFLATHDKGALEKMEELAEKHDLEGYQTTDADRAITFYHDNYLYITITLSALLLLALSAVYYSKVKLKLRPIASGIFVAVLSIALFLHINIGDRTKTGITASPTTYVMSGPSPGASLVDVIGDGHRVEVLGKNDVWLKIRWEGDVAYVREQALLPVEL